MLYIIGTGLNNEQDMSLRSLEILKNSTQIFLESYTSKSNLQNLQKIIQKEIKTVFRNFIECTTEILDLAEHETISLLIIGTPFFATTHTDILIQARERNIKVEIVHNTSIMNIMGCYGLFSYSFGRTVSIPFFEENWKPTSFYDKIVDNKSIGLHTLVLLDIRVDENSERYMTPNVAIQQLLYCENELKKNIFEKREKIIVVSRFGKEDEKAFYKTIDELINMDFGEPLHSLIIPGKMEIVEKEHVELIFKEN